MIDFHLTTDALNLKARAKTYRNIRAGSTFLFWVMAIVVALALRVGVREIVWASFLWILEMVLFFSLAVYAHIQYKRVSRLIDQHCCTECGYDLTGTIAAGKPICPECGYVIESNPAEFD